MAIPAKELREWLSGFADDDLVGVTQGGLTLVLVTPETIEADDAVAGIPYIEVGGIPAEDELEEE